MPLTEKAVGDRTLNLSSYSFDLGTYTFYVKAVGKPSIVNKMSNAVTYARVGPVTTTRNIAVSSPSQAGNYTSPLQVSAMASSPSRITGFKLYVDGSVKASSSSGSLQGSLTMSRGTHYLTFKAWDSTGASWKKSMSITIR